MRIMEAHFPGAIEPLHLNLIALLVAIAGSFRAKVAFDLVLRQQHAFSLVKAADYAKELGIPRITAIELGVANGTGLMNICRICRRVTDITGVEFDIVGFDTGLRYRQGNAAVRLLRSSGVLQRT